MSPLSHIAQNASVSREPAGHKRRLACWLAGRICLGKRCQESLQCTRTLVLKNLESTGPFVATDKHVFVALFNKDHVVFCGGGRGMGGRKLGFRVQKYTSQHLHSYPPPRTAWLTRVRRMLGEGSDLQLRTWCVQTVICIRQCCLRPLHDVCRGSFVE